MPETFYWFDEPANYQLGAGLVIFTDEQTPVIQEIPKIECRYYTTQICDEWMEIITNINERIYPEQPYGRYALCRKGSRPEIPEGTLCVDLSSKKANLPGR